MRYNTVKGTVELDEKKGTTSLVKPASVQPQPMRLKLKHRPPSGNPSTTGNSLVGKK